MRKCVYGTHANIRDLDKLAKLCRLIKSYFIMFLYSTISSSSVNGQLQNAPITMRGCTDWSGSSPTATVPKTLFPRRGSNVSRPLKYFFFFFFFFFFCNSEACCRIFICRGVFFFTTTQINAGDHTADVKGSEDGGNRTKESQEKTCGTIQKCAMQHKRK